MTREILTGDILKKLEFIENKIEFSEHNFLRNMAKTVFLLSESFTGEAFSGKIEIC